MRSPSSASVQSVCARSAGTDLLERVGGDEQADRLLLQRQQLGRSNSPAGIGAWPGVRERRRRSRRRPSEPEVEDRSLADQRVLLGLLAGGLGLLEHREHALADAPVEPNAPHLISASIAFLLTARLSTRSQKSNRSVNGRRGSGWAGSDPREPA